MSFLEKKKNQVSKEVFKLIDYEKKKNIDNIESCLKFKKDCESSKKKTYNSLINLKNLGKKLCGYGATSKSTTIMNYCNIDNSILDYICDTTKDKIGKYSPGKHIPIVSMSHFYNNKPDICYLFAWNHKKEIFKKENSFLKNGGKWFSHVSL